MSLCQHVLPADPRCHPPVQVAQLDLGPDPEPEPEPAAAEQAKQQQAEPKAEPKAKGLPSLERKKK